MTHKANDRDENFFNELDSDQLRQAVQHVRRNPVPEDAQYRALERAHELASMSLAVRRHPTIEKRTISKLLTFVAIACLLLLLVALARTVGDSVQAAREAARRSDCSNKLRQIGLAIHNYHDAWETPPPGGWFTHQDPDLFIRLLPHLETEPNWIQVGAATQNRSLHNDRAVSLVDSSDSMRSASSVDGHANPRATSRSSKIIHAADVVLVIDEITKTESQLSELVNRFKGYVGNSQILEPKGQPRSARWVVRIPVDSLDSFLREVVELGTPENRSTNTHDVTEEYVDLKTRIDNKKQLEKRILALLEKSTGDIKDVLTVEEQLARVREEIEKMEGRVKQLDDVTSMTTVAISAREERDYVPPQSPSFSTEISRTWGGSIGLMQGFGKSLFLAAVAVGPWLPFVVVLCFVFLRILKRWQVRHDGVE